MFVFATVFGLIYLAFLVAGNPIAARKTCDSVNQGYQCQPEISHHWGQYSPYFLVPSEISAKVPPQCEITFVQILSRHGARDPTASKTATYNDTIEKIKSNVKNFTGDYAFLADYEYTLGADQLTVFGEQEMINSGTKFFDRYPDLAQRYTPFIRSSSESRVVESAQNFSQGYHQAKISNRKAKDPSYPYPIVVISEDTGSNNTLNHGLCTAFEDGPDSSIASNAQKTWQSVFTPPITTRLNANLPGANLSSQDTISIMDLCPFNTIASPTGQVSPFCALFTEQEWREYDYYETLNKYYGYSYGNPLGPTQGVGFTNELIARMTDHAVMDETSTNRTLDDSKTTFPLGKGHPLYADFSHDNDITAIFSALGLYNNTSPLSNTTIESAAQANGYSASWTVPFAARAYFEKMSCMSKQEELVRVIVNDRVLPLTECGGDKLGRCKLSSFIGGLTFAMGDGFWDQCFAGEM
ncbi:hypothetical protein MMC25_005660 [Agyrium rufum]|nr:hypothetical protein [Agyrium rufum]